MVDGRAVFKAWVEAGQRGGLRGLMATQALVVAATAFGQWCARRSIDPARYMRARYEAVQYRHRIPLARMASPKFAASFAAWGAANQAAIAEQERLAAAVQDARMDVSPMREQAKARYAVAGLHDVCLSSPLFTGGYRAASVWCVQCPVAAECAGDRSG